MSILNVVRRMLPLLCIFAFGTPNLVFAQQCNPKWCDSAVDRLWASTGSGGTISIKMSHNHAGLNCSLTESGSIVLYKSHAMFNEIYSLLLTAIVSGLEVRVRIVEGSNPCQVQYAWILANAP